MLVESKLKQELKGDIKGIENKLYKALNDQTNGIYNIQKELDDLMSKLSNLNQPYDGDNFKDKMWKEVSHLWAKALSEQIIKILSDELSSIIAKRMTSYIKSATITIPPGQIVTTPFTPAPLPGVTSGVSPKAIIK